MYLCTTPAHRFRASRHARRLVPIVARNAPLEALEPRLELLHALRERVEVANRPPRVLRDDVDLEALWILCRAGMGCIEAALSELGEAAARVKRERTRWQTISAGSFSLAANHAARNALRGALRLGATPEDLSSALDVAEELAPDAPTERAREAALKLI